MSKRVGGFIGQDGLNAPDSPTSVSATAGNTEATVSFTAPSNVGGSAVTGYVATSNDGIGATGSSSPITVTGLTNDTSYTFNVWAINPFGWSSPSDASGG
jgi:large repetitive protein